MQRIFPALFLLAVSNCAFAGTKVTLGFPDATDKVVFVSSTWPDKDPSPSTNFKALKADYTVESTQKTDRLYVIDPQLGRVASKAIGEIQNNTWNLSKEDFSIVYKLRVEVTTPKGPVSAASVELQDASGKRTELVDPSSAGAATFMFVKPGDVKIAVSYKADGKTKDPVRQTFTVGGDKDSTLKIALPDGEAVPVASSGANNAPAAGATPSKDAPKDEKEKIDTGSNPLGGLLMTLISFAIVAGILYWIVQFLRKHPDQVKDTLTKLGADVPKPPDPNDNIAHDPNPVAPIAPQPMQQIILDPPSSPSAIPSNPISSGPISMPTAAVTGIPKLIATDGSAFDLPEGETVVGREFGNGLVVPNDTVSRKHASLLKMGTSVEVQDHGSTNGTWVNGAKVVGSQTLRPGDAVRFGSIEYRYEG